MVLPIYFQEQLLAMHVCPDQNQTGVQFVTPDTCSQQVALIQLPKGKSISPHSHQSTPRTVNDHQEVFVVQKGRVRVSLFSEEDTFAQYVELCPGDVLILLKGGHGIEILEDAEFVEIKQGPYGGEPPRRLPLSPQWVSH